MNKKILSDLSKIKELLLKKDNELAEKDETLRRLSMEATIARNLAEAASKDPQLITRLIGYLEAISSRELKIPSEIDISNLGEVKALLERIADRKDPEPVKEVAVSNLGQIKTYKEVEVTGFKSGIKVLSMGLTGVLAAIKAATKSTFKAVVSGEVRISNRELADAIPVRLASRDLRYFYDAMVSVLGAGGNGSSDTLAALNAILAAIQGQSTSSPTAIGDGTSTVTTAGTRVQLPNVACKKVYIQAHESNTGTVVIGGSTCVAALSGRRGLALKKLSWQPFEVNNLNLLYVDSTANDDKINYTYEA